mmetsp:Transcript_39681/g.86494  ORF Transcript_39681/g.86494 Transcript_39681/m.86494 type:complete len:209 (-) Transcript_39681:108-734(-)
MQALDHDDLVGLDELRGILEAGVMVVDWLVDGFASLQRRHLRVHQFEVVLLRVQGRQAGGLAPGAVIDVVVVEADHRHHVADCSVAWLHLRAEGTEDATQESGLPAARISCNADHDGRIGEARRGGHHHGHALLPVVRGVHGDVPVLLELLLRLGTGPDEAGARTPAAPFPSHKVAPAKLPHRGGGRPRGCQKRKGEVCDREHCRREG